MARKARQKISYVIPLANSPGGHRLGVNSLAVDPQQSILYSAGRDGVICAWDISRGPGPADERSNGASRGASHGVPHGASYGASHGASQPSLPHFKSTFRKQVQAHTHWVNDIVLARNNTALVSASSDITVKLWRPDGQDAHTATTIGIHSDYVKCLASPGPHADWVASGGLDRKIKVWDLSGKGERLQLNAGEDESSAKGSVYALSVRGSIMASGGPEGIVRLWDSASGKRITKFMGHTDNVRDILISQGGDMVMTASSDQTIKVWSMAAGRCMHTLTMHNDSVWSLYSDHPQLSVFYSSDRSGVIAKTDVRGSADMDEGLSISLAQEHEGVNKILVAEEYIWSATSSSSVNRWKDVEMDAEIQLPDSPRLQRRSSAHGQNGFPTSPPSRLPDPPSDADRADANGGHPRLPLTCILRISNAATLPFSKYREMDSSVYSAASGRKFSEAMIDPSPEIIVPFHDLPAETIEGQNGLIKHVMLNDRRRVLTLDTVGEVMLWDLLKCVPIQSFGKRHLDDVTPEVNTMESIANWCGVDTRTGKLAVSLEENYCFDAEMYADEIKSDEEHVCKDDQRINLGRWILRYLFANLVDEEIQRDEALRLSLLSKQKLKPVDEAPAKSMLAPPSMPSGHNINWLKLKEESDSAITPRAQLGQLPPLTPASAIGLATPASQGSTSHASGGGLPPNLPSTSEESHTLEKRKSHASNPRMSGDYFSHNGSSQPGHAVKLPGAHGDAMPEALQSPSEPDRESKSSSLFGKKFKMSLSRKLGRTSTEVPKPAAIDDRSETSEKSSEREDKIVEDNFHGILQKIRIEYDELLQSHPQDTLPTGVTPSQPPEAPILRPPAATSIIIQEDRPDSGGVEDLYRGTVESTGRDADLIEKAAPMWLGELLLRNQVPFKEIVKVSFVLQPQDDRLPSITGPDGNSRLNANRMLRAKKILAYIADRIEPKPEIPDPNALKPEEYLDLYCHDQLIDHHMTLATLRAHVWKTSSDVMLYYKSNGRRPELEENWRQQKEEEKRAEGMQAIGNGYSDGHGLVTMVGGP